MSGSTRITFVLTLPDGRSYDCVGRLVETLPARQPGPARYRSSRVADLAEVAHRPWLIHMLQGPEIFDEMTRQTSPLDVVLSDGRVGKVVISDEATLNGRGELTRGAAADNG